MGRLGHVLSLTGHGSGWQDLDTSCPCLGMVLDGKAWTHLVPDWAWLRMARLGHLLSLSRHGIGWEGLDTSCPNH
ncbi:unnamed protein product [Dracunculus medinensis]|uniref:Secreted protein n=1 Tax=Dracunculus medinensis TaxID=318479 RepID=A0A0N4UFE3_DRAME|nr:unnamed protein product [Dracunculus medinensis]